MAKQPSKFRDHDAPDPRLVEILSSYYQDAAARLRQIVINPNGSTASAQQWNQARASVLFPQVDQVVKTLRGQVAAITGKALTESLAAGTRRAEQQAREAGILHVPELQGSFHLVDHGTLRVLARDTFSDLDKAADSMGKTAQGVLRRMAALGVTNAEVNKMIAGAVISGKPAEAISQLRQELRKVHGDTVTIKDKNGDDMTFGSGYYAKMVAVTKPRQATCQARHERLKDLGLDLVTIVGKVSNSFCTAYLDKVFSISGKHEKYPPLSSLPDGGPPFHPNCSKSTAPWVEDFATDAEVAAADPKDLPDAMLNTDNTSKLQRSYQDLQLRQQVEKSHEEVVASITDQGQPKKPWDVVKDIPRGKIGLEVSRSLNAIGAVHDLPANAKGLEIASQAITDAEAFYDPRRDNGFIAVDPNKQQPQFSTVHEFGHYLDNKIFARGQEMGTIVDPEIFPILQEIGDTTPMQYLLHRQQIETNSDVIDHIEYLLHPAEVWARAYSQWISSQSSNAKLRSQLEHTIINAAPSQWQADEFRQKVAPIVEKILRKKGVLP